MSAMAVVLDAQGEAPDSDGPIDLACPANCTQCEYATCRKCRVLVPYCHLSYGYLKCCVCRAEECSVCENVESMSNKCQTARHDQMPQFCLNSKHQHCDDCNRCYTCHEEQMSVKRLHATPDDTED